jgi:hypothetical protein
MKGSASQKAVLPVLAPDLSYEGMEVADGGMAMNAYARMCGCNDLAEIANIRSALPVTTLGQPRYECFYKPISFLQIVPRMAGPCHNSPITTYSFSSFGNLSDSVHPSSLRSVMMCIRVATPASSPKSLMTS